MSPPPRRFRSDEPSQWLDASNGDLVAVGIFSLPFFYGLFVFGGFFVSEFEIDCPHRYSVDYNPVPGLVYKIFIPV
jgi:hypothetical protein